MIDDVTPFIFASGKGTRLRPHTEQTPKPLLSVQGEDSFLDLTIQRLARLGFKQVFVNYSYRLDLYEKLRDRYAPQIDLILIDDTEVLGHGGVLRQERQRLKEFGYVLGLNGDSYIEFDLDQFLAGRNQCELRLLSDNQHSATASFLCDSQGRLFGIDKHPHYRDTAYWYHPQPPQPLELRNYLGVFLLPTTALDQLSPGNGPLELFSVGGLVAELITQGVEAKVCQVPVARFLSANTIAELEKVRAELNA